MSNITEKCKISVWYRFYKHKGIRFTPEPRTPSPHPSQDKHSRLRHQDSEQTSEASAQPSLKWGKSVELFFRCVNAGGGWKQCKGCRNKVLYRKKQK